MTRAVVIAVVAAVGVTACAAEDTLESVPATDATVASTAAPPPEPPGDSVDEVDEPEPSDGEGGGATTAPPDDTASGEADDRRTPEGGEEYGVYERVSFPAGSSGTTVSDGVVRGTVNGYLLEAAADQTMTLEITSLEDNASFLLYSPDDTLLASGVDASVVLPADGDYLVVVASDRGNASFDLTITIG